MHLRFVSRWKILERLDDNYVAGASRISAATQRRDLSSCERIRIITITSPFETSSRVVFVRKRRIIDMHEM